MATARAIERRSFAAAGLVVFANEEYRARAVREGLLRGDSEVVPNGWSLPDVPPDPRWRDGAEHLLAYVGTIGEQDNVDHLVDARRRPGRPAPLRVVVAGAGSALAAVKHGRASAGSAGSFEWLGLVTERARIAALVRAADVCVAPEIDSEFNRLATFVKVIEYMSAGAAVVAHRLPQTEALAGDTIALRAGHDGRGARRRDRRAAERSRAASALWGCGSPAVRRADQLGARRRAAAGCRLRATVRVAP